MVDPNIVELIQKNAELVRSIAQDLGATVDYDEQGVKWLDGYIERIRTVTYPPEQLDKLVNVLGSFLGECIRRQYGGHWEALEGKLQGHMVISFDGGNSVFPFSKVSKQFEQGNAGGESVAGLFHAIPNVFPQLKKKDS